MLDTAIRDLKQLNTATSKRIVKRMKWLAENMKTARLEHLANELAGLYKFRVGSYRVIYEIIHKEKIVLIHAIGHRRDIYRKHLRH